MVWAQQRQAPLAVKRAVSADLDALLGDTVNEGDIEASVKHIRGIPQMDCLLAPSRKYPALELIKCQVSFLVINRIERPYSRSEQSCFVIYTIQNRDLRTIRRGPNKLIEWCLENLGSGD
ncbi:MAG: hypothetical protein HYW49_00950 [Deltaproteobacteria bacterium]|nr:hypothetical protein [Deltaproteobacteria bacterium]